MLDKDVVNLEELPLVHQLHLAHECDNFEASRKAFEAGHVSHPPLQLLTTPDVDTSAPVSTTMSIIP